MARFEQQIYPDGFSSGPLEYTVQTVGANHLNQLRLVRCGKQRQNEQRHLEASEEDALPETNPNQYKQTNRQVPLTL